ncbi:hypothetical protein [Comamonas thiooxydans]|uniref:hypothetical protein n=1 Tax=Comamonas thiooxydans TaxID=363952 RepID=UPI000B40A6C2|nr:hypothetical protein [Comamonas thiooxydans]
MKLHALLLSLMLATGPAFALNKHVPDDDIITEYPEVEAPAPGGHGQPAQLRVADYVGSCEPSANGLGIGSCKHGISLVVLNAPAKLKIGQYRCTVSWMLERPHRQSEILEFDVNVSVPLAAGAGSLRYEVRRDLEAEDDFEEDPLGLMRTDTACVPLNY